MAESKASSDTEPDREPTPSQPPSSKPDAAEVEANDGDETETEAGTENGASQATDAGSSQSPAPVRRSGRARAAPVKLQDSLATSEATTAAAAAAATSTGNGSRRNPKRKASEPARQLGFPPSVLLNEALRPLEPADIEEWEGWIELESEPAFFTIILRDLGIQNVKAQELFTLDQASIDFLPKPVYGLIFLFEYHPALDEEGEQEDIGSLWFANQVTQNACATVALLNIIMNVPGLELGPQLRQFKASTASLPTALRGHKLSADAFIRRTHNSFTRRINHLNADLALENEASRPKSKKSRTATTPRKAGKGKGKGKGRKKVEASTYGYHFIAYVPAGGDVWELDGLKSSPHRLGPDDSEDWTSVVRPQIEARMLQYEETQLSFNLLALCRSPLVGYTTQIARALSSLRRLHYKMSDNTAFKAAAPSEEPPFSPEADYSAGLPEFNLSASDIEQADALEHARDVLSRSDLSVDEAVSLHRDLVIEAKAAIGEYRAELVAMADDDRRVQGRKRDFGPALHKWVTKLAEKGVLENIIKET